MVERRGAQLNPDLIWSGFRCFYRLETIGIRSVGVMKLPGPHQLNLAATNYALFLRYIRKAISAITAPMTDPINPEV